MTILSSDGRFVLLIDLLGFSEMVERDPLDLVCKRVEDVLLDECERWASARPTADFGMIYFSDTVLLYSRREGRYKEWYDDLGFIGSTVCSRLLSERIPVRGSMAHGSFTVRSSGRHQVFAGRALVEAHRREQSLGLLGFSVSPPIYRHFFQNEERASFSRDWGEGIELADGSLHVNFLTEFQGMRKYEVLSDLQYRWEQRSVEDLAWLDTEILALAFVAEEARDRIQHAQSDDTAGRVARKYIATHEFLQNVLGKDLYEFALSLIEPVRRERASTDQR
jgi:hypothetical protein